MSPRRKYSDFDLAERMRQGKSVQEIADEFGVHRTGVSKRIRALKLAYSKNVTMHHAGQLLQKDLDAMQQLLKINEETNTLLDRLMAIFKNYLTWEEGLSQDDEQPLTQDQSKEQFAKMNELLGGGKEVVNAALRCNAEIRQQLNLQLTIFQSLYDMKASAEFQEVVLEEINKVAPTVRDRIVERLRGLCAIRSVLDWGNPERLI